MFLSQRATQAEYFDSPDRSTHEITESYESLASLNRMFLFADPFKRALPKWLGSENCRALSFLDLGAGDGSLGVLLAEWAAARCNWDWRFTNLDFSAAALRLGKGGANVAGSVLALPFKDRSFDVVIASQMTHHLTGDAEVTQHLREAWRVARKAVFISDLHRGPFLYCLIWLLMRLSRYPPHFQHDSILSIRRGFRVGELQALAERAGLIGARAWLYYGARVILQARKAQTDSPA